MKHIKLFESFMTDFRDEVEKMKVKYINDIRQYLFDINDEFPSMTIDIGIDEGVGDFICRVHLQTSISTLDTFKSVFHQGLFERIKDDMPGTSVWFHGEIMTNESIRSNRGKVNFDNAEEFIEALEYSFRGLCNRYESLSRSENLHKLQFTIEIEIA